MEEKILTRQSRIPELSEEPAWRTRPCPRFPNEEMLEYRDRKLVDLGSYSE